MDQIENPGSQKIIVEQDEMYVLQPDFALTLTTRHIRY